MALMGAVVTEGSNRIVVVVMASAGSGTGKQLNCADGGGGQH